MVYYRVKPEFDGASANEKSTKALVKNELYTEAEIKRYKINLNALVQVEISRKDTYRSFGCRFQSGTGVSSKL